MILKNVRITDIGLVISQFRFIIFRMVNVTWRVMITPSFGTNVLQITISDIKQYTNKVMQ